MAEIAGDPRPTDHADQYRWCRIRQRWMVKLAKFQTEIESDWLKGSDEAGGRFRIETLIAFDLRSGGVVGLELM